MSNFCLTSYHFEGDKHCLRDFYEKMKTIEADDSIEDYRKRRWMARLASAFALNPADYYCRGYFDYVRLGEDDGSLSFEVESGNVPCDDLIDSIINYYDGRIYALWFVECPDEGEYFTNDLDARIFKNRYEVYLEDIDSEWFETIPQALEWIHSHTGISIPRPISQDLNLLYQFIIQDLEEILNMTCNFHIVNLITP